MWWYWNLTLFLALRQRRQGFLYLVWLKQSSQAIKDIQCHYQIFSRFVTLVPPQAKPTVPCIGVSQLIFSHDFPENGNAVLEIVLCLSRVGLQTDLAQKTLGESGIISDSTALRHFQTLV